MATIEEVEQIILDKLASSVPVGSGTPDTLAQASHVVKTITEARIMRSTGKLIDEAIYPLKDLMKGLNDELAAEMAKLNGL